VILTTGLSPTADDANPPRGAPGSVLADQSFRAEGGERAASGRIPRELGGVVKRPFAQPATQELITQYGM